ncbi:MinD/ParA family ATP-binding protein [Arthrobacter echini]|uniref:MinD/ParA family ATP-binding protein n=1 Tax=Arthrobacter echini TaxID=1529066 RepID=UPI001B3BA6AF|nr:ATPase [Arthrobacter echini]
MTHEKSARTTADPQDAPGGARRRRAQDIPPRFVDRFSPGPDGHAPEIAPDSAGSDAVVQAQAADEKPAERNPQEMSPPVRVVVTASNGVRPGVGTGESLRIAEPPIPAEASSAPAPDAEASAPPSGVAATGLRPREGRRSFLTPDDVVVPAETGFRGFLAGLGIRLGPSAAERAVRADVATVSRHWPGPRTISVVNGKGGANKTPTTVLLAAVFARNGGGPVLAWDNNETRGTLGWRTEQGPHEATVLDLLPQTDALLAPSAQSALLARYVHHQTADKFDVLRSKPAVLASEQKVTAGDFDALHEVASKYFRLNVVDSGNDETAERWLRMIHHTDQLVIATTTLEEHAEAGALLLEALRDRGGRYGELARQAVVIISQSDKNGSRTQGRAIADGFGDLARRTLTIPFDVALLKGRIRFSAMRPATQRAWLAAAAAVAEGL